MVGEGCCGPAGDMHSRRKGLVVYGKDGGVGMLRTSAVEDVGAVILGSERRALLGKARIMAVGVAVERGKVQVGGGVDLIDAVVGSDAQRKDGGGGEKQTYLSREEAAERPTGHGRADCRRAK